MPASGSLLAQTRPSGTTAATAYTATARTEITRLVIANVSGSSATCRLFHDDDGTTYDQTTALLYDATIAGGESLVWGDNPDGAGIIVAPGGTIGVRTGTASAFTFTLYGITQGQV